MTDEHDPVNRDRGILTQRDRKFLLGRTGDDLSENAKHQRLYNIRGRVENAIHDLPIIADNLSDRDLEMISEPVATWARDRRKLLDDGRESTTPEFTPFLQALIALHNIYARMIYIHGIREAQQLLPFIAEQGIERGYRQTRLSSTLYRDITVDLDVSYGESKLWQNHINDIRSGLPNDPTASYQEIYHLYRNRKISYDQAQHLIESHVRNPLNE